MPALSRLPIFTTTILVSAGGSGRSFENTTSVSSKSSKAALTGFNRSDCTGIRESSPKQVNMKSVLKI
jgi:hypothetical protein